MRHGRRRSRGTGVGALGTQGRGRWGAGAPEVRAAGERGSRRAGGRRVGAGGRAGRGKGAASVQGRAAGARGQACYWASKLCTRCTQPVFGPV